jgi:hypothetical protein
LDILLFLQPTKLQWHHHSAHVPTCKKQNKKKPTTKKEKEKKNMNHMNKNEG